MVHGGWYVDLRGGFVVVISKILRENIMMTGTTMGTNQSPMNSVSNAITFE